MDARFTDFDWYKEFHEMDLSEVNRIQSIAEYVVNEKLSKLMKKQKPKS